MKRTALLLSATLLLCACRGHRHNYAPRPADPDPPAPGMNPYDDPVEESTGNPTMTPPDEMIEEVEESMEPKMGLVVEEPLYVASSLSAFRAVAADAPRPSSER